MSDTPAYSFSNDSETGIYQTTNIPNGLVAHGPMRPGSDNGNDWYQDVTHYTYDPSRDQRKVKTPYIIGYGGIVDMAQTTETGTHQFVPRETLGFAKSPSVIERVPWTWEWFVIGFFIGVIARMVS